MPPSLPAGRTRIRMKPTGEVFSLVPPTSKANNVILGGWLAGYGWLGDCNQQLCAIALLAGLLAAAGGRRCSWQQGPVSATLLTATLPALPCSLPPLAAAATSLCNLQARLGLTPMATTPCSTPPPAPRHTCTSSPAAGLAAGATRWAYLRAWVQLGALGGVRAGALCNAVHHPPGPACLRPPPMHVHAWSACSLPADQRHDQPGGRHPCVQAGGEMERVLECRWVGGWVGDAVCSMQSGLVMSRWAGAGHNSFPVCGLATVLLTVLGFFQAEQQPH